MYIQYYDSPLGKMLLSADEIGLIGVWFENQKYYANGLKEPIEEETAVLKETKEWLNLTNLFGVVVKNLNDNEIFFGN